MFRHHIPIIISLCLCSFAQATTIDLSGKWSFALDPNDVGINEQWHAKPLSGTIRLPGSLQEQGYGDDVGVQTKWTARNLDTYGWYEGDALAPYRQPGNIKFPYMLQPKKNYVGTAWYQREVDIPASWKGKYIELELERTHWETTLYVNGKEAGKSDALLTPQRYAINETGKLLLTLRVDNRVHIPIGVGAHSVTDHTQTNWNGIIGQMTLKAKPALHIADVRVYPDVKAKKAKVEVDLIGTPSAGKAKITLKAKSFNCAKPAALKPVSAATDIQTASPVVLELTLGDDMLTWSEYEPNLYRMEVELSSASGTDVRTIDFGMREFKADGTRFTVNGTPIFLRGTLECAMFPLTGYPSLDPAYWTKIYRRCKEFGLNHVRFHSWCPPGVAFEVADREGIYLQVECGGWTTVGDGWTSDKWFYAESERIVKEYGNHPSFCMMLYGNEPGGNNQVKYLSEFVDYWKAKDSRRVYTSAAGWPYIPNADYWNAPDPRIQPWDGGLKSIINAQPPQTAYDFAAIIKSKTMPTVSHEIGQWCVYPNFKEIAKYTGVLQAKNFEIFQETLGKHHLGDLADKFLYASGRLQTLCYKADIEAALRTPGFAGFQLLGLYDYPGYGTALVGVLDPFWDTKGYSDGQEYSRFCNRTVPLARMDRLVWTNEETFKAAIEVSHFDKQPLSGAAVEWELTDASQKTLASGKTTKDLPIDNCIAIEKIEVPLLSIKEPSQLTLSVKIDKAGASNQWHIWVYPAKEIGSGNKPYFTTDYNDAVAKAKAGGNVLYSIPKDSLKPDKGGDVAVGFSSIFWNTAWTAKQPPHTLGIYCDATHPALAAFPNEGCSDYQWWDVVAHCSAMVMDDFPADFRPVVHLIDDWFTNRKLGILFETKAGAGKIMVCSADIVTDIDNRPAARQFRRSVEQYMVSDKFNPSVEIDLEIIKGLLKE
ncbi:beta-galactosidase [Planctomycetales bacterium]|nr:beta-galactosidase [Planctomycetales bacterium]